MILYHSTTGCLALFQIVGEFFLDEICPSLDQFALRLYLF